MSRSDEKYMKMALEEAKKAYSQGEVPVGVVVVCRDEVLVKTHNQREKLSDPTAHAEIIAIRKAAEYLKTWRLADCALYVTKEPCPMCAGAMVQARLGRLVYGAADQKSGAAGTVMDVVRDKRLNHQVEVSAGVLEEECRQLLQDFFSGRR